MENFYSDNLYGGNGIGAFTLTQGSSIEIVYLLVS